ncbi:MAG: nitroreductase family protein [Alkalispirochaeta sp.]
MNTTRSRSEATGGVAETVLASLGGHASCRHYADTPVSDKDLERIIGAAQRAATSSNLQMWSVVVVRDQSTRESFAEISGGQKHIRQAPVTLVWCADRSRLDTAAEMRGYLQDTTTVEAFLVAAVDTAIAAQNAAVAAEALGYGTCYLGSLRNDTGRVVELLGLPERVFPVFGMTLGVPAGADPLIRPRLPLEAVLHRERYNPASRDLLEEYDRSMAATEIYRGRQQNGVRPDGTPAEPIAESGYGWLEHSARRGSLRRRAEMTGVIRRQGYALE